MELFDPGHLQTTESRSAFTRYMHEHPIIGHYARTGDGQAYKISDFLTRREVRRLALYNEYAKPFFGTDHQMAIAVSAIRDRVVGITVARSGPDFSARERLLLNLLRPHLVQALRNVDVVARLAGEVVGLGRGMDAFGLGLVVVDVDGRTRVMTTCARQWGRRYFGPARPSGRLPDAIRRWMIVQEEALADPSDAPRPRTPLVVQGEGGQLVIRHLRDADGSLLLMEERRTPVDVVSLERLGLTTREAEVLAWVAAGKTSADTAEILGGRPRTVDKHLERIYRKLGVEHRTAAAAVAHALSAKAAG